MAKGSLYEITEELARLEDILENAGGEIPDGIEGDNIIGWLETFDFAMRDKIDGYGFYWSNLKAEADALKTEADRLLEKRGRALAKIDRLKAVAEWSMTRRNVAKMEGQLFRIVKQKNGGLPPLIIAPEYEAHPELLPELFKKTTVSADKEKLRNALESDADKVEKYAKIGEVGYSIRLK